MLHAQTAPAATAATATAANARGMRAPLPPLQPASQAAAANAAAASVAAPAASPSPPPLAEHAVFLQQASHAHKVVVAAAAIASAHDAPMQSSPSHPSLGAMQLRRSSRPPSVSSPTHLAPPVEPENSVVVGSDGSPSLMSSRIQPMIVDESPPTRTEHLAQQALQPQQPQPAPAARVAPIPSVVSTKLGTPPRTTVPSPSPSPATLTKRLAWNGQKSEQAEPAQSASTLALVSPKQLTVTDSQQSLQSNSPTAKASPWACIQPRYVSSSDVSTLDSPGAKLLEVDDYPWRNTKPTDSCAQRFLARLPRVLLKTFLGVRLIAWILLLLLFGTGLGLSLYVWLYFATLVRELTRNRFGGLCYAQARIFSLQMSTCLNLQRELAHDSALFGPDTPYSSTTLGTHFAGANTITPFSALHFFTKVEATARSDFETARGAPILSWDAATGTVVTAPASSITSGPFAGAFFPATIRVAPDDRATGLPSGFELPAMLDLASLPGLPAALLALVSSNGTAQISHAHFVANYSTPTRADGLDSADPLSQPAWLSTEDTDGALKVLTHDSGYRMLMLSASLNTTASPASLRGVLLSSFDLTPFVHALRFAPVAFRPFDAEHRAQLDAANIPRTSETASFRVETRGSHPKRMYNERNPGLVFLAQHQESSRYQDADTMAIATVDMHSNWDIGMYLSHPSAAMDWSFGCTASPQVFNHFMSLDEWRRVLGGVVAAFLFLVTILLYVLMRWHNTIFLERLQKNASIAQMDQAIREAEMARDQKTDFMAFLCHELRNPLHAVLSMSDSLQDTPLDADQSESVFTIHASSELMLAITNDILDLSKIEAGKIELDLVEIDLYALVYSLVRANNSHAAEKGITVCGKMGTNVPRYIRADPTRINQMLGNLLSNAIKFSKKHGGVRLEVELVEDGGDGEGGANGGAALHTDGRGGCDRLEVLKQDVRDMMRAGAPSQGNLSPKSRAHPSVALHMPHSSSPQMIKPRAPARRPSLSQLDASHAGSLMPPPLPPPGHERRVSLSRQGSFSFQQAAPGGPTALPGVLLGTGQLDPIGSAISSTPHMGRPTTKHLQADSMDAGVEKRSRRVVRPVGASGQFEMLSFLARSLDHSPPTGSLTSHGPVAIGDRSPSPAGMLERHKASLPGLVTNGGGSNNVPPNAPPSPARSGRAIMSSRATSYALNSPSLVPQNHNSAPHPTPLLTGAQGGEKLSPIPQRRELKLKRMASASNIIDEAPVTSPVTTPLTPPGPVRLAFRVSDDGCGISSDYVPALFEPYTQAKRSITRSHGGTGLGLAIVKKLCDLMDATITVESEVDVGTNFTITCNFETVAAPSANIAQLMQELPQQVMQAQAASRFTNYASMIVPTNNSASGTPHIEVAPSPPSPQALPPIVNPFVPSLPMNLQQGSNGGGGSGGGGGGGGVGLASLMSRDLYPIPTSNAVASPRRGGHAEGSMCPLEERALRDQEPVSSSSAMNMDRMSVYSMIDNSRPPSVMDGSPTQLMMPQPALAFESLPPAALIYSGSSSSSDTSSPRPGARGGMSVELARRRLASKTASSRVPSSMSPKMIGLQQQQQQQSQSMQPLQLVSPLHVVTTATTPSSHDPSPHTASDLSPCPQSPFSPSTPVLGAASADSTRPIVLVVDDAAINRKIMLKALQSDYDLDMAENGLEAVQMVEANPTRYCCVLMDLMMPVMSGTEALQQIRAKGFVVPVVAVTANTMQQDVSLCLSLGFSAFLSKPCRKETVRSKIRELRAATAEAAAMAAVAAGAAPIVGAPVGAAPAGPAPAPVPAAAPTPAVPTSSSACSASTTPPNDTVLPSVVVTPPTAALPTAPLAAAAEDDHSATASTKLEQV